MVVANSNAGREYAVRQGFPTDTVVVPNGIDTERFSPQSARGNDLRRRWGIPDGHFLFGVVARLDPMKDHATFIKAAAVVAEAQSEVSFVCVGGGNELRVHELKETTRRYGLEGRLFWVGSYTDMPAVYSALDGCCLSSAFGEGFPNVLGEAMSCGVCCVTTDVGDASLVVGDLGVVVEPANPEALGKALLRLARLEERPGSDARERIRKTFSLEKMVADTEHYLCGLLE